MSGRTGSRAGRPASPPPPGVTYRAVRLPSGALLPIEARVGRRVLRTIPPDSDEGRALLAAGEVEIVERRQARTTRPPSGWLGGDENG